MGLPGDLYGKIHEINAQISNRVSLVEDKKYAKRKVFNISGEEYIYQNIKV